MGSQNDGNNPQKQLRSYFPSSRLNADDDGRLSGLRQIRIMCAAAGFPDRAQAHLKRKSTLREVRSDLFKILAARDGPELEPMAARKFAKAIQDTLLKHARIRQAYKNVCVPRNRRKIEKALRMIADVQQQLWPLLEPEGIYLQTDALELLCWLKRTRPSRGGPTPRLPAARCAIELSLVFKMFTRSCQWRAKLFQNVLPATFRCHAVPNEKKSEKKHLRRGLGKVDKKHRKKTPQN